MDSRDGQTDSASASDRSGALPSGVATAVRPLFDGERPWRARLTRRGAVAGLTTFLVGYLLTALAFLVEMQGAQTGPGAGSGDFVSTIIDQAVGVGGQQLVASSGGELALALRSVGWTFFSAQGIPLSGTASGFGVSASGTVDVLTVAGKAVEIPLTPPLYYLIPPVCLAVGGWWLARRRRLSSLPAGAVAGGLVVVGYLPCVALATALLAFSASVDFLVAEATVTARPVLWRALLFGTGYAVVFGSIGGAVAAKMRRE